MFKVLFLLKRKEGITHEQFREPYERSVIAINCRDGDIVNTGTGGRHGKLESQAGAGV